MVGAQRVGISYATRWLTVCILMLLSLQAGAVSRSKRSLLWRIHTYAATRDTVNAPKQTFAYARATIRVEKRNPILWAVPSAYFIARGNKRQFLTESYSKLTFRNYNDFDVKSINRITNIPGYHRTLPSFNRYMTPTVYSETLIGNTILSPFHPLTSDSINTRSARYAVTPLSSASTAAVRIRSSFVAMPWSITSRGESSAVISVANTTWFTRGSTWRWESGEQNRSSRRTVRRCSTSSLWATDCLHIISQSSACVMSSIER